MQSKGHKRKTDVVRWGIKGVFVILALVFAIAFWSMPVQADRQVIRSIEIEDLPNEAKITIESSAPLAIHENRIGDRFLVFDLYGSLAPRQHKQVRINSGGIREIKCGWYKNSPPIVRIAVGTSMSRDYAIERENGERLTVIRVHKDNVPAVTPEAKPSMPLADKWTSESMPPVDKQTFEPISVIQDIGKKPVLVASTAPVVAAGTVQSAVATQPKARLISLDFVASDIHDVIKALAVQGQVNIVASSDVKGEITASLDEVSVEDAMKLVTSLSGYQFTFANGSYIVGTAENIRSLGENASGKRTTDVAIVRYADPAMVTKTLQAKFNGMDVIANEGGENKGSSLVILSGYENQVEAAMALVDAIDRSVAQQAASQVVEYYEVKHADINELAAILPQMVPGLRANLGPNYGFRLTAPRALEMGSGADTADVQAKAQEAPPKVLVLQGVQQDVDRAREILAQLDAPLQQIIIEAQVLDITDDAAKDLGIRWHEVDGTLTRIGMLERHNLDYDRGDVTFPVRENALSIGRMLRLPIDFQGLVRALQETGRGRVLANPNVMALEGKPATIFIGDEFSYVIRVEQTPTGENVLTETAKVGVQLLTIARVSGDEITMDLHPEVSVITRFIDTAGGLSLPLISRRFVDSTIRVRDGETIVIGGLIREEEIERMSGIPLLKDLPIIGGFFRTRSTSRSQSEIMMFITPRIVADT